jgi:hypothetical protein
MIKAGPLQWASHFYKTLFMRFSSLIFGLGILFPALAIAQKQTVVTGTIRDGQGKPVNAASVQVLNRKSGTTSDSLGVFQIRLRGGEFVIVNSIGFTADTVKITDTTTYLSIVLQPSIREMEGIVVTGTDQNAVQNDPMHILTTHSAGATLNEFMHSEIMYSGQTIVTPYSLTPAGMPNVHDASQAYITNTPANTFYRMSALPAFTIKEDTKGNRYLLADRWGQGVVITRADSLVDNKALKFNFDKIQQKLYTTRDQNTIIELDKQEIKAFAIKDGDSLMIFDRVTAIDSSRYFIVLVPAVSGKYALYRDLRTKFVKSDYHSDGMTESGNPYDEYVDNNIYYVILPGGVKARRLEMSKKYIKSILPEENNKVNEFFSKHRYDEINETLLKDLINYLNDAPVSLLTNN